MTQETAKVNLLDLLSKGMTKVDPNVIIEVHFTIFFNWSQCKDNHFWNEFNHSPWHLGIFNKCIVVRCQVHQSWHLFKQTSFWSLKILRKDINTFRNLAISYFSSSWHESGFSKTDIRVLFVSLKVELVEFKLSKLLLMSELPNLQQFVDTYTCQGFYSRKNYKNCLNDYSMSNFFSSLSEVYI